MFQLTVNASVRSYKIKIEKDLIKRLGPEIKDLYKGNKIAVITDMKVYSIYKDEIEKLKNYFECHIIKVKGGEESKSFDTMEQCCEKLASLNISRKDLIIAFGGGVVGDLAGFIASTYLRGVDFIQVPTTLLSQVDSSVGGKVAINLKSGKNLVGNFYQPKGVFIDPCVLDTLEQRQFNSGMAEVIKYACIKDLNLLSLLKKANNIREYIEEIIYMCCKSKAEIVSEDEFDKGIRMILNFGHTIGHAIENIHNYKGITHGEAVSIGMYMITENSEKLNETQKGTSDEIKELLEKYNLNYNMIIKNKDKLIEIIKKDKKSEADHINIILLEEIGKSYIKKIQLKEIVNYLS